MNLIHMINASYGRDCLKELRRLEQLTRKRARQRNHLRFNLRCRDEGVVPASLNIKTPIPTNNARKAVDRARKILIKERIRCTSNTIKTINAEYEGRLQRWKQQFPLTNELDTLVQEHLHGIHEKEFTQTKNRHMRKLERLVAKKVQQKQNNTETRKRWVHNISSHKLTQTEHSVLTRGLNYAITPRKIPHEQFILATELACERIPDQGQKAQLRNEVAGILRSAKTPPSNITKAEEKAIKNLAKNNNIMILPADKGRTTVILDTEQYETQMRNMLADTATYEVLRKDPTEDKKKKLKAILKPLLDAKKIEKTAYNNLIPTANITLRIYGTPKIHKPGAPLRPIVDSIGSVTYNLSKALAEIIKPLLGQTEHHCKNAKQLAEQLRKVKVEKDEMLISHDVVSLFTKTPVKATLHIIQQCLETDRTLKTRTLLTAQDISQLLNFIATSTYFQFRGTIYRQKEGFAMGDPLSAIMCGFFMEHLEKEAITSAPEECRPTLWRRYVDDILEKIKIGRTQQLTDHLNSIDQTGNIQFTHEEEKDKSIAFLDIKIHHTDEGDIRITIYRKPTHTDQYLLWTSEHPIAHKLSVVRTLYERASIITDPDERAAEEQHIRQALAACQYPPWAIQKGSLQVKTKEETQGKKRKKQSTQKPENKGMVILPYIKGITERIQRAMKKHKIQTPVKPHTKLRQLLVHPKDKIDQHNKCNVIYEIPCRSCNKSYIGETGRTFNIRKNEHKKECEKETEQRHTRAIKERATQENLKSAITDHCRRENHIMDWDKAKVIQQENNRYHRWIKESMEIRKRSPSTMNRDEGAYMLSHTWTTILGGQL